jgi:hypothetical protein
MLGSTQTDPIWLLSIAQQRQAELIADVRNDAVVPAARDYRAVRIVPTQNVSRGRLGRLAALVSAGLRISPFAPTTAHGA